MSFRALLTITDGTTEVDYCVHLGDDWQDAAEIAGVLRRASDLTHVSDLLQALKPHYRFSPRSFDVDLTRERWIEVYGDQTWVVDLADHTAIGKDSEGEPIK